MPSRRRLILLVLMLLLSGMQPGTPASASPDLSGITAQPNDCDFLIRGTVDPRPQLGEISCGTVRVPENWSEPDGRQIEIAYTVLKATGPNPKTDPIVYLAGGPGTSPLTRIEPWAHFFAPLREDRDFIIFDQRGTRLSSPLRCDDYDTLLALDLRPEVAEAAGIAPSGPPSDPADVDAGALLQAAREQFAEAAKACAAEITAQGVDLSQYNTLASANDVVALMSALGYDEYNLYSLSYGTRLALEVMRSHPEAGVRSVVLDSTYPPEIKSYEEFPLEPHEVVIQLFADCQRNAACAGAYPNLQNRFVALLAKLKANPIATADGTTVSDRELVAVLQTLGNDIPAVPYVPLMISELEQGDTTTYEGIVSGSIFASPESAASPVAEEATAVVDPIASFTPARQLVLKLQAALDPEGDAQPQLLQLDRLPHSRDSLQGFIAENVMGDVQTELLAAVDAMSDVDVEESFDVLEQTITLNDIGNVGVSVPQFYSVECNERIPFQSLQNMVAFGQNLAIPSLSLGIPETFAKVFAICEEWPSGRADDASQNPVWSSIPTLIFAGAYDNLTPVSWNKSAFATLPNADFVLAPMAGHGVIVFSECAQNVADAFIDDPLVTPDTSCFSDLQPDWAIPG